MRVNQNKQTSNKSQAKVKQKSNVHTIEQFIGSVKRKINGLFDVYL
jgi:hypothetical protein